MQSLENSGDEINFAERLNYLFDTVTKTNGASYTHEEVYHATGITVGYISRLRSGKATNPGYDIIRKLSTFFKVSPNYFFGEEDITSDEAKKRLTEDIALRASHLDDEGVQTLVNMLEYIDKLRGSQDKGDEPGER